MRVGASKRVGVFRGLARRFLQSGKRYDVTNRAVLTPDREVTLTLRQLAAIYVCLCLLSVLSGHVFRFFYGPMTRCGYDSEGRWVIGVTEARSPLDVDIGSSMTPNPVLTCARVNDVAAVSVAQPFLFNNGTHAGMLYALKNAALRRWEIWRAWSTDRSMWRPAGPVLAEEYSVSFPLHFQHKGQHYMLPDTAEAEQVRLYKADSLEGPWKIAKVLLEGVALRNPTPINWAGRWYLIGGDPSDLNNSLVYHAEDLFGPWREHPVNKLESRFRTRVTLPGWPAGRVVPIGTKLFRYVQLNWPSPQSAVRVVEIKALSETEYDEVEVARRAPFITPSATRNSWYRYRIHHFDAFLGASGWLTALDAEGDVLP